MMSGQVKSQAEPQTGSVWVVIVAYNSYSDTADCLRSLKAATWPDLSVTLVDNGSTDGSGDRLRREFPEFSHIVSTHNLGFAGGCNLGIREALKAGADFICLLNNDTLVEPGFIEPLVARFAAETAGNHLVDADTSRQTGEPRIGVAGGKIFYDEPGEIIWFAGGVIDRRTGFTSHTGQDQADSLAFNEAGPVDYITGCLFLVPARLFRSLGLLDERLFMYCEEVDFCLRARRAGYRSYYEPASVIRHRVSRSMGGAYRPVYYYYQTRNLLEVYHKNLGGSRVSLAIARIAWRLVVMQTITMLRAHRKRAGRYILAIWRGLADYLAGKFGKNRYGWLE